MRTRPMRLFLPVAAPDIPSRKHSEIVKSWDYPEIPQIWSFFFHSFFGAYSFCPWLQRLKMCFLNMNERVKDEMCHEITGLQQMGLKEKNAKIAVTCQCCLVSVRAESNLSHVAGHLTGWFCLPPGCHLDDSSLFWDNVQRSWSSQGFAKGSSPETQKWVPAPATRHPKLALNLVESPQSQII